MRILAAHDTGRQDVLRVLSSFDTTRHICREALPELLQLRGSDALFRPVYKSGAILNRPFSGNVVNDVVQRRMAAAGYQPMRFGAHSLRAGFITQSFRAGSTHHEIMRQTGHRSVATVEIYSRENDPLRHNAVTSLGM